MINIKDEGLVLEPRNNFFEEAGVLNPACIEYNGQTVMLYRAVTINNYSTIGLCRLSENKVTYRSDKPVIFPEFDYERQGVEDPRITFLDGTYYILYTAYDGKNARIALATTKNFEEYEKQGLLSSSMTYDVAEDIFRNSKILGNQYTQYEQLFMRDVGKDIILWEKDAVLFPKKINGKYAMLHRILPAIQICFFDQFSDLNDKYWKEYFFDIDGGLLIKPDYIHENGYVGAGCPPLLTEDGWLLIYHSVEVNQGLKTYHAAAALLDKDDPKKVIGKLKRPLFSPISNWEVMGNVNCVVFPTGLIENNQRYYIYYGAADKVIGCKSVDKDELLSELKNP